MFRINRFLKLLKKDTTENYKFVLYAIFIALFIEVILLSVEIIFSASQRINLNSSFELYYYISLIILGGGVAGLSFPAFRKPKKAINFLTLPASALEKYLSFLILSSVGFFIVYTLLFVILDYTIISIINVNYPEYIQEYFTLNWKNFQSVLIIYFITNSLFLLGAATFTRYQHFLTIWYFGLGVLGLFFIVVSVTMFYSRVILGQPGAYSYSLDIGKNIEHIIIFGFVLFFWFVGYLKVKEKEI